ncbi:MAG: hypothetical protein KC425_02715 [Anaerolineales bacterium]|nr:hypothetical protein [Anaerolineales bacterium]
MFLLLTLFVMLVLLVAPVRAQSYSFAVPQLYMQAFVQPDASLRVVYDITFANASGAPTIEVVDIGTLTEDYDIGNMSASMGGTPLTDIRTSTYIDTGVEIHLEGKAIPPGASDTLHFEYTVPDLVYQDTTREGYASLQLTPTWFEPESVRGDSDIWVVVHMLPEVQPDQVLYQDVPFSDVVLFEEHTVVSWRWEGARATQAYEVGVSFPQAGMTRVIEQTLLDLTREWLLDNPGTRLLLGLLAAGLFTFAFFRYSGGTGWSVYILLAVGGFFLLSVFPVAVLWVLPLMTGGAVYVQRKWQDRKKRYLPAIAQVEGGGIKRGLTAPEAAVLLELPLNKVLLLVVFGLLEKSVVRLVDDAPLAVELEAAYQAEQEKVRERRTFRRDVAKAQGIVLRSYEHWFLDIMQAHPGKPLHRIDFGKPMKSLIEGVAGSMKNFDLSDTQDYYRKIIAQAMAQATQIGEVPEYEAYVDKNLPWILMGDDYGPVFRRRGYTYHPTWVRPYVHPAGGAPSLGGGQSGPSAGGRTSFGDVAAAFAGWTEAQTGQLASAISPTSLQVKGAGGGFINLSGADKVTTDIFKAMASSSGSGGSGGGCACAGCACACACAGGGR